MSLQEKTTEEKAKELAKSCYITDPVEVKYFVTGYMAGHIQGAIDQLRESMNKR